MIAKVLSTLIGIDPVTDVKTDVFQTVTIAVIDREHKKINCIHVTL